jgi:ABC-type glycerol-3-phosphate transport system substrate-binding protein
MMVLLTVLSQTAIGWGAERVVRLEYWFGGLPGSQTEAMSEIISLFEAENPNVKVDMVLKGIPEKYEPEALPLAIAGGVPCDVAYLSGPQVFEWSLKGGFLVPLNGLLQASRIQQFENNCLPGPRSLFSRKGIWYGAPFRTDTRGMYMNVDLLEGAGFGSTIGPKDIAELDRYAAKLTRWSADGKVEILGFAPNGNNAMDELIWLWAFGGEFLDEETGKLMFAGKAAHLDALTWIQGYANQYGARARATLANFMNGSAAMHINSTTRLSVLPEQAPELNWYTSHIPVMPQANPVSYGGVLGLAIPVGARYPNEAARFVAFLARPDIQVRWYRLTQTLPTRVEAFKQILPLISDHRERILVEQLPVTRVAPPLYPQLKQVWEGNLNKLRLSEISPQVFLEDLQRKMEPAYREIFTGR